MPGFVSAERVESALARALCMVLPSRREGYGMVVIEAAALGTPSVVVADPDNAAADLVIEGENGYVAPSASPEDLGCGDRACACRRPGAARANRGVVPLERQAAVARELARKGARELRRGERPAVALHRQLRGPRPAELRGLRCVQPPVSDREALGPPAAARSPSGSRRCPRDRTSAPHHRPSRAARHRFEQATGKPRAIASSTGRPKPS